MALGCTAPTSAFGAVVKKAKRSTVSRPVLTLRTLVHCGHQMPAKKQTGRSGEAANQMSPPASRLNSLKAVKGTRQRLAG